MISSTPPVPFRQRPRLLQATQGQKRYTERLDSFDPELLDCFDAQKLAVGLVKTLNGFCLFRRRTAFSLDGEGAHGFNHGAV